ncbi:MAG: hypothetical protein R3B48_02635 [Kofleriaceae bacterium]
MPRLRNVFGPKVSGVVLAGLAGLAGLARPAHAAPDVALSRVVIVGRAAPGAPWRSGATEARLGDAPELAVVLVAKERAGRRVRQVVIADDAVAPLVLDGRAVRAAARRGWGALPDAEVSWSTIEPHAWRDADKRDYHSNVSLERATFGRWQGYDPIAYFATEIAPWRAGEDARRLPARITPSDPEVRGTTELGTLRYQVQVRLRLGGEVRTFASPGVEATDRAGILPSVHRVTVRRDDTFLGYLTGYLLVPEVFGSGGAGKNHQTERYTGADCADVLVGAARAAGLRHVPYTSVAGLPRYAEVVAAATALDERGAPPAPIRGVRAGDLIRIDYGGALQGHTPRAWDHVAVLFEDRSDPQGPLRGGPDGQLDGFDLVIHMGHPRLVIEPLSEQSPSTVDVLRWRAVRAR